MWNLLLGERSLDLEGLVGGVAGRLTGGDLDGGLSLGGELRLVSAILMNHIGPALLILTISVSSQVLRSYSHVRLALPPNGETGLEDAFSLETDFYLATPFETTLGPCRYEKSMHDAVMTSLEHVERYLSGYCALKVVQESALYSSRRFPHQKQ